MRVLLEVSLILCTNLVYDSHYERLFQERYDEQRRVHNLAYENKRR
jgi:hypothetical protein